MDKSPSQPRVFNLNAIFASFSGTDGLIPIGELADALRAAGLNPTEAAIQRYGGMNGIRAKPSFTFLPSR
jgi:Ca2+-binding EF-hand superfamily protein